MSERSYHNNFFFLMDSGTDFFNDSDYVGFANEIPFVDDILHPFLFELVFTVAEIQAKTKY